MAQLLARRAALAGLGALMVGSIRAEDGAEARAVTWLAGWDSHDIHRTATAGDRQGADWLTAEARALGATVDIESFPLDRLDPVAAFVELEGTRYPGVAMFDAPDTRDGRVHALANEIGKGEGLIGLGVTSPLQVYSPDFQRMRRETPHWALVLVTEGGAPGLALLNAESFTRPYGPAILQVPSELKSLLFGAIARGAALRVVTRSTRTRTTAPNVVVTLKGRDATRPPLVVMTPRSSWFVSTAERGGGLVCWLECLRALAGRQPGRDVVFTANSGHELGHIGLDAFLDRRPGWLTGAEFVHFGANIGAAGGALSVVSGHDDLRARMSAALTAAGLKHATSAAMPNGETRDIHRAGGRYITLVGGNALFHLPQDRLPHAVAPDAVVRAAAAAVRVVSDLAA